LLSGRGHSEAAAAKRRLSSSRSAGEVVGRQRLVSRGREA